MSGWGRAFVAVCAVWWAGCGGVPRSPTAAFDQYMEAYADGDAERLWQLSSKTARADARRLRRVILDALSHEDPVHRVQVEGLFGASAADVGTMDEKTFFAWAVHAIRRRLGPAWVKNAVSQWERVAVQSMGPSAALVVYREQVGRLSQLRVVRVGDVWFVDTSPFPSPAPQDESEKAPPEPEPLER